MLKKVLVALAAVIVILLVVIATRPGEYRVARSVTVAATPALAWEQVADFHKWEAWSPWAKIDPGMKTEYAGPTAGTGASYHWAGNDKIGEGRMTITDARPGMDVVIRLEFIRPWASVNTTTFAFAPDGAGSTVTWTMAGQNTFMGKAMSLFVDMDRMIGPDFEKGLAALRGVAESEARRAAAPVPAAVPAPPR
jgi:hypothetical protein